MKKILRVNGIDCAITLTWVFFCHCPHGARSVSISPLSTLWVCISPKRKKEEACLFTNWWHQDVGLFNAKYVERILPSVVELLLLFYICYHWYLFDAFFFFLFVVLFFETVSSCSPGCSGTSPIDQASLELRDPPVCPSSAGIKGVCHCQALNS